MTDGQAATARLAGMSALLVGLSLLPAQQASQETGFDRLWSHDTGG